MNILSSKKKVERLAIQQSPFGSSGASTPGSHLGRPHPPGLAAVGGCWFALHLSSSVSVPCGWKPPTGNQYDWSVCECVCACVTDKPYSTEPVIP